MSASDKVDQAVPASPPESVQATATRRHAAEAREQRKNNRIEEKYYELSAGHKLVLCKKKTNGSVHRTLVGSTKDKENGPAIAAQINKLAAENKLRARAGG